MAAIVDLEATGTPGGANDRLAAACGLFRHAREARAATPPLSLEVRCAASACEDVCRALLTAATTGAKQLAAPVVCTVGNERVPFARVAHLELSNACPLLQAPSREHGGRAYNVAIDGAGGGGADVGGSDSSPYEALGILLARCILEGVTLEVELSRAVLCSVLEENEAAVAAAPWAPASPERCIESLLRPCDSDKARQLQDVLERDLTGNAVLLVSDLIRQVADIDDAPLTEATKCAAVRRAVLNEVIGQRAAHLRALRRGFQRVTCVYDAVRILSGAELGHLLLGGDAASSPLALNTTWLAADRSLERHLRAFLANASPLTLRVLMARVHHCTSLCVAQSDGDDDGAIRFIPEASMILLPRSGSCDTEADLMRRMADALDVSRESMMSTAKAKQDDDDDDDDDSSTLPGVKRCPSCRVRIEKNGGCLHMTCSTLAGGCGHEFWWCCLGPYSADAAATAARHECVPPSCV